MDLWKYFDLGHRDHAILNPTSSTRLDELIELLDLPDGGRALEQYGSANPGDPDVPALLARCRALRDAYLRWGRDTLGWAMYLFAVQRGV